MFRYPRSRLRIWSREKGLAVPSRVILLISIFRLNLVLNHGVPLDFRDGAHLFIRPSAVGSVPSYQAAQLRTDGVHYRESSGGGPVVIRVVLVPDAAFSGIAMDKLMRVSLFPTPTIGMKGLY